MQTQILMKVHSVLSALLIFESSFVLIIFVFVHGMQNEPPQTSLLPTEVVVCDLVFLKINMFPLSLCTKWKFKRSA